MPNQNANFMVVYGVPNHSMWEVSEALKELNVSHMVIKKGPVKPVKVMLGHNQPRKVLLTDYAKGPQAYAVNFVVASYGELSETNYPALTKSVDLPSALKAALGKSVVTNASVQEKSAMDYVEMVSKPSLLNDIQTLIYNIQPYSLRKETNALVLSYLNSTTSEKLAMATVKRNMKTERLAPLLVMARPLREAVAMTSQKTVDEVSELTGIDTFDLNYLIKTRK